MFFISLFHIIFGLLGNNNSQYFKDYQKDLPVLPLPYTLVCGVSSHHDSLLNPFLMKKFVPASKQDVKAIGELFDGGKYVYILYSIKNNPADPWLYTYKKDGRRLDSLCLHKGYCFSDFESDKTVSVRIEPDRSIVMTDSTINYRFDSILGKLPNFTLVSKSIYKPNTKGLFKLFSERSDTLFSEKN